MNLSTIKSYEDLPLTLNASQIASILGISKSCAYTLLHREDFPTVRIGRRMIVSKTKFERWLESQDCGAEHVDKSYQFPSVAN